MRKLSRDNRIDLGRLRARIVESTPRFSELREGERNSSASNMMTSLVQLTIFRKISLSNSLVFTFARLSTVGALASTS